MAGRLEAIPVQTILAATEGDELAMIEIVNHYQNYIRMLSTRPLRDKAGHESICLDEYMRSRLENKLVHSILTGFTVRSA